MDKAPITRVEHYALFKQNRRVIESTAFVGSEVNNTTMPWIMEKLDQQEKNYFREALQEKIKEGLY